MKVKKGDNVIIIAGKDKGKKGKVIKSIPRKNKVVVEGINISKQHKRPKKEGQKGQVVSVSMPLHVSNVQLANSKKRDGFPKSIKQTSNK